MEKLTKKEEEIMNLFWDNGAMFVKDILDIVPEPKPHFNTISTMVRALEAKGYVSHKAYGNTYQYFATVQRSDFGRKTLKNIIKEYFGNSYKNAVSALVDDGELSSDEIKELLQQVENQN
ncbi:MAG: BlaI/MecI/CopY family transcriptional regulator [Bacteroidales bacterium]|jgi:predicted transcriptional regulator|nr:BlaI/MecI/CopY family transcriptional regulator [Bacteroidales bacterium]MBQ5577157.1 BlaI/MecI/CopY family transcriptional regulator [Bacteroidales bacterium]MBR3713821.1 BlaI/MecI/CopY family transcriptional regulator [Bacteroidales bacterium]